MLDVRPVESGDAVGEGPDERCASVDVEEPVEEVGLDDSADLRLLECCARDEIGRGDVAGRGHVDTNHRMSDDLCGHDQQGVVDEGRIIIAERRPERRAQQPRP